MKGYKAIASKNKAAVTKFAKPVRAPDSTPVDDSTYDVISGVPNVEEISVPIASANNALSNSGIFPLHLESQLI